MDLTYRFRYLLYFAAFMLVMSVCFAYGEPVSGSPAESHLLFQIAPQHAGFLASASSEPTFDPAALRTATAPSVSPETLQKLVDAAHGHHGLLRRTRHVPLRLASPFDQNESSVAAPGADAHGTRQ